MARGVLECRRVEGSTAALALPPWLTARGVQRCSVMERPSPLRSRAGWSLRQHGEAGQGQGHGEASHGRAFRTRGGAALPLLRGLLRLRAPATLAPTALAPAGLGFPARHAQLTQSLLRPLGWRRERWRHARLL